MILRNSPRHEASTVEATPGRGKRDEQAEAHAGNSAARGGPQLELSRRWLKPGLNRSLRPLSWKHQHTCTCIYWYLYNNKVLSLGKAGRRRCRPPLTPRVPAFISSRRRFSSHPALVDFEHRILQLTWSSRGNICFLNYVQSVLYQSPVGNPSPHPTSTSL